MGPAIGGRKNRQLVCLKGGSRMQLLQWCRENNSEFDAEAENKARNLNILSDSVSLQRVQVGAVERGSRRVALGEGRGRDVVGVPGNRAEEARRRRGRAAGGARGKRRQLRQLRVESRLRLRLLLLAVHGGRRADRSEVLSVISRRGA